jgi:hypothetical protein
MNEDYYGGFVKMIATTAKGNYFDMMDNDPTSTDHKTYYVDKIGPWFEL